MIAIPEKITLTRLTPGKPVEIAIVSQKPGSKAGLPSTTRMAT